MYDLFLTRYQNRQNTIKAVKEDIEDEGELPIDFDFTEASKTILLCFSAKIPSNTMNRQSVVSVPSNCMPR
jgi:hypothetical protein